MMENRKVQFWAELQILRIGDFVYTEKEFLFSGDEDAFADNVDDSLSNWIQDHKRFGLKEYGWKYVSS